METRRNANSRVPRAHASNALKILKHCYILLDFKLWESQSVSQFSRSVAQSCPTLCDPMNHSMLGLPVHHQLLVSPPISRTWQHPAGTTGEVEGAASVGWPFQPPRGTPAPRAVVTSPSLPRLTCSIRTSSWPIIWAVPYDQSQNQSQPGLSCQPSDTVQLFFSSFSFS